MSPSWAIPALMSVILAPVLALFSWHPPARRAFLLLVSAALASLAAVVFSGGDVYWGLGRFLAPCTTLATLALLVAGFGLRGNARWVAPVTMALLVSGSLWCAWHEPTSIWPRDTASGLDGRENEAFERLRGLGVHTFAQTDYQRAKFYDDDLLVIDATGLNDKIAAHLPAPGQVLRGKGGLAYALSRSPDALSYGTRSHLSNQPMALFTSFELTHDAALVDQYLFAEAPGSLAELSMLTHDYRPVSYPVWVLGLSEERTLAFPNGSFMNVWLRNDLASKVEGVTVAAAQPSRLIALDSPALEGFSRVERSGDQLIRWTTGLARVAIDGVIGANCEVIVTTWYGSLPFGVTWDGQPLSRAAGPRWSVAPSAARSHVLGIESETFDAGDRRVGVLVSGVALECAP